MAMQGEVEEDDMMWRGVQRVACVARLCRLLASLPAKVVVLPTMELRRAESALRTYIRGVKGEDLNAATPRQMRRWCSDARVLLEKSLHFRLSSPEIARGPAVLISDEFMTDDEVNNE